MLGQSVSRSSSTVSSPSTGEPVLKAVLASLDIQIDEELARYRRHRLVQRRSQPTPSPRKTASAPAPVPPSASGAALPAMAAAPTPSPYPELMPSPWDEPNTAAIAPVGYSHPPLGEGTTMPDDYLESSEHLLRSLGDEEPEAEYEESLMDKLLTPVGIGALLFMLLSSAMLGFLIVNPSMLGIERWGNLLRRDSESSVPAADPSLQANADSRPYPNLADDEFVDLSLDTLSTLPGRSPLPSPLGAKPSPSPAASPAAPPTTVSLATIGVNGAAPTIVSTTELPSSSGSAPAPAPAPAPAAAPAPAPIPEVAPEPVAAAPAYVEPAPEPVAAAPAPSAPGSYYYVVTDYSGDRSLEDAQSVVDDAYVRNFDDGAQVQLGAFSTPERAQELIQELQQQGISAEMYQP